MFCTECGQPMADEAKFCAFCGTRRINPAVGREAATPPVVPAKPDAPVVAPPPLSVPAPPRPIRSTAEIMPIRAQRPVPPPPPPVVEASEPEFDDLRHVEEAVPWQYEQEAPAAPEPPPYLAPPPGSRPPARPAAPVAPEPYRSVPFAADPGSHEARRGMSPVLLVAVIVAVIALAGIVWMVRNTSSLSSKPAGPVTITIYPTSAKVAPGKGVDFVSEVTGAPGSDVTWTVEEGDSAGDIKTRGASSKEDTISLYCTYTAPAKPGTYHLVATSTSDKTKSASAEITVAGK